MILSKDFKKAFAIGEQHAVLLDNFFKRWYKIYGVTMNEEMMGYDRIFIRNDKKTKVEYKSDIKATQTGNIFIETQAIIKDDEIVKPGWIETTQADVVITLIGEEIIAIYKTELLKDITFNLWFEIFPKGTCKTDTHNSRGILVPMTNYLLNADKVMSLKRR